VIPPPGRRMQLFSIVTNAWNALPSRACSATESMSILRILAACAQAQTAVPPMLAAWARCQRAAQANRIDAIVDELTRGVPLDAALAASGNAMRDDHLIAARFAAKTDLLPQVIPAVVNVTSGLSWRYRSALGYLAVVLFIFLGVSGFLSLRVMPLWAQILHDFDMDVPYSAIIAQAISPYIVATGACLPILVLGGFLLMASRRLRRWLARPFQAGERRAAALDLLGIALGAGRPLPEAAHLLAASQQSDQRLTHRLEAIATDASGMARSGLLRPVELEQWERLSTVADQGWLLRTAAARRRERTRRRWTLAAELIVPVGVALMGSLVLIEAFAVLGPLRDLVQTLS
jgi:type II secretory pathway component PulF